MGLTKHGRLDHERAWHILEIVEMANVGRMRRLEDPAVGTECADCAVIRGAPAGLRAGRALEGVAETAAQHGALVGWQRGILQQPHGHTRTQDRQIQPGQRWQRLNGGHTPKSFTIARRPVRTTTDAQRDDALRGV